MNCALVVVGKSIKNVVLKNSMTTIKQHTLSDYVRNIIKETPTGGHWSKSWWSSRYTDLQNDKRVKSGIWNDTKLDFSFEDLFNEVLLYYKDSETAIFYLKNDDE